MAMTAGRKGKGKREKGKGEREKGKGKRGKGKGKGKRPLSVQRNTRTANE
jgi:hypothetical protein